LLAICLVLVRALPTSLGILVSRLLVLFYLVWRLDYRAEIKHNFRVMCGRFDRWFWVRNGWRVGRNLALMTKLNRPYGNVIVDNLVVYEENTLKRFLEQELHTIMVSFHFGVWEFLPQVFAGLGFRVNLGIGAQKNGSLDRILSGLRRNRCVRLTHSIKQVISWLKQPGLTGFMLDNTSQGRRVWVDIDGCHLGLPSLPFRLAARKGVRVVPLFAFFESGRMRVKVYPAGDERAAAQALLDQVRARPEEWVFWAKTAAVVGQ